MSSLSFIICAYELRSQRIHRLFLRSDSIDKKLLNSISLPSIDKLSGPTEKCHVNSNIFFKAETSDKLFYFERMSLGELLL